MRLYLVFLVFLLASVTSFSQVSTFTSNVATGNWNVAGSWTEVGSDVDNIPDADDIVIILTGHNISLNGARSASALTINSGGTLTANGGGLTVGTMSVNGTGTYVHAIDGGTIPTATWASNSNCNVTGVTTTTPAGFSQTFGNLTWNSSGQNANLYLQSNITIQGNFSVLDTGLPLDPTNRALRMSNTAASNTINVTGNMVITNSTFKMNNGNGSCTLNVGGNFTLNSGNFTIVTGSANSTVSVTGDVNILGGTLEMQEDGSASIGTLNVTGNFSNTGGSTTETGGGSGSIIFNRAGTQIFTSGGSINNDISVVVNSGSFLQLAAAGTIVGGNNFTLSSGASLGIRSTAGITSAGATGNIQGTGTRSFSTGANYIYNGSANQSSGDGVPGTVSNLTIANTGGAGNNTVTLVNNVGITNALDVSSGVLALGANNITTVGSVSMTGTSITGTGTLTLAGNVTTVLNGTTASINAPIALGAASRTFTVPDGGADPDLVLSATISGTGSIIKSGAGLINVFGANSYTGLTTVNAGIYRIGSASALGSTAAGTVVANGAALDLNGISYVLAEPLTINGTGISGGGAIFNSSGISATFGGVITLGSASSIIANNQITLTNALTTAFDLTKGGSSTLSFTSNPVNLNNLIVSSGTLVSTSGTLTISGNFTNSGTFSSNGGTVHYDGSTPQIIANVTYNNLTLSGAGQKNGSGAIATNGNLINSSIFDMGANALTTLGTVDNTGGNLRFTGVSNGISASTGTVTYYGASQTITSGIYNNLVINQSSGQASLGGATIVNGILTLTNGALNLNAFDLNLGSASTISVAGPSATKMIIASTGGQVIKTFNGIGSFTFPIGDNTGAAEYSPITVNVTSGSGFPSNVGVSVVDAKHPNNSSTTNFLTRYWQINSGITSCVATISGTYLPVDISGIEASVSGAQLTGVFNQSSNPWVKYGVLGANTLTATTAPLTVGQPNIFTGITSSNPTVTIVGGGVSICPGSPVNLTTNVTGDPTFTYSWTPSVGLSATNISNPIASPTTTTIYTVNAIDGNGQIASNNTTITVYSLPIDKIVSAITSTTICNGGTITLRVATSEPGVNYEIQDQSSNPVSVVAGGTGSNLDIITSILSSSVTSLKVVATNASTLCSLTLSSIITPVTVNAIPATPTIGPVGPITVCEGSAGIVLTSSAGAGNQWYKNGAPIGGATATTLNIATAPGNSGNYTVISTVSSCSSIVSAAVSVTINALPLITPIVTPATATICSGSTVTVNIAGSQAGINYELFNGGTSLSSTIAGTGGAINLVTSALTANTTITVRATNPVTSCTVLLSGTSVVTVNAIPATPTIGPVGPITVCEGSAGIVLTSSAGAGNQWYKNGAPIGGATATTLNIATAPGNSGNYTVISTVSSCSSIVSAAVSVTINALPLITPIVTPATATICSGSTVTVNIAGSQAGINYELFNGGTSLSSTIAGTGGAINLVTSALTANTTITVRATNPVTSCTVLLSGTSVVTVNAIPATPTIGPVGPITVCEGSAGIVLTSSAGAGNQWYKNGAPIGGATATTLNIATAPGNSGNYTVISTVSSCSSIVSAAVSVTINALPLITPIVTPATATICSGSTVTVNIAGSQAGINYELFNGGTSLSSTIAGTGGAINLVTSALTANTTITVRATNPVTSCTVLLSGTSVVTVNAIPATPTIGPVGPITVCEGSAGIVLTSSAGAGNQWYKNGAPIGGATATTLNIATAPGNSGNYTVISTVSSCSSIVSAAVSVTINALPLITPIVTPATATICSGSTVTVNIAGSQAGINYELFNGGTSLSSTIAGTGGAINLVTSALTANTTITVRATNPVTSCTVLLSGTSVVTVNAIPATPTIGPVGPITVCEGSAGIVLTSSAGAGNQWYKNGAPIGGATATTLNIATAPGNSGNYTVISTVSSCSSIVSAAVSVTINALPLITPIVTPATATICSGSTVTVNIAGSQAGINYELFNGGTSLSSTIAGTGGAINLVTSALTANTTITVRATNPVTSCTVLLSGTSVVTVNAIPATPTIGPVGPITVCEGSAGIVLTSSAGAGNQWYKNGAPIGGATATTLNIATAPGNSGNYTVISTVSSCSSIVSAAVSVTINALPLITPIVTPATATICSGSTVTVNIAGSQAGINYELFNGGTSLSSTIAGTGGAINLVTSALTANTTITVRATNPVTSCTVLLSGTSVVTVNAIPATPTIGPVGPITVCEGSAGIVLTSSAGAGNQWYKNGAPIGGATATTLNIATAPGNSGNYTVISTVSSCSSIVSAAVSVTINALPLITPIVTPATATICSGSTVTVNIAGSQAGINYELFNGGTSLSSTIAGTGGAINLVTSALTANTTITVRATNPVTSCTVLLSGTSVVTVNAIPATPTIGPVGPITVCEGSAGIVLTSSAGAGNQWYKNGAPIGGATATTLNIATAPGNSGNYTVISTVSSCSSGVSVPVNITINPLPLTSPGVSPVTAIICSGSTVTTSITGSEIGINYQLYDGATPISSVVAGTGGAINITTVAISSNLTISVLATNPITGCTVTLGGTTTVTLSAVIPTPTISPAGPLTACVGDPVIVLTSSAASGNQWYKDGAFISGATNQTLNVATGVVNSGSYTVIETQAGCTSLASAAVDLTINSIASPPVASSPTPICVGGVIPTLTAIGTNLIWYSDASLTTQVGTGSPFTPTVAEVNNAISGTYSLYVTQTIGCESPATQVDVIVNPSVIANAGTDTDLCNGLNIALGGSPTATGGSGSYSYSWTSIPAGFTSTQSNPVVIPSLGTTTYVLQVTDANGCQGNDQIDVTTYAIPTFSITNNTNGGTGQICSGASINISLSSPTAGATITLQNVNYGAVTGGAYAAGGTFVSGNIITEGSGLTNPTNSPITINYIFRVATPNCANPVTQQTQIVVNPTPAMSTVNGTPQICGNSPVSVTLNSSTSGATIRVASVNYGVVTGTLSPGATFTPGSMITETLINSSTSPVTVQYNFEVLANGCTTTGFTESVIVNPNPTFIASNSTPIICSGNQTNILFGSATAGHQINVVNVYYGFTTGGTVIPGVTTFNSATPLIETLNNNTNSPIDVVYEFNVTTPGTTPVCPLTPVSQFVTVTVNPNPNFTVTNNSGGGSGIICSGSQTNILLNTAITGGQVRLKAVTYGAVSGTLSAGAIFNNGQTINESLTNSTGSPTIVSYDFEAIFGSCTPSASQIVTVEVRPLPNVVALPASQTICSGATTGIALSTTNGVGGATYTWTRVDAGVSGVLVGSGASINETLTATGSTGGTATYTITPAAGSCNGTPITVIVTVNPLPNVVAAPSSQTICSGTSSNIALSTNNGVAGATYSWTVVQSNVSGATSGFGTSINQILTATTSSAGTATYTITPSASGCNGTPIVVVVTVSPVPNVVALPASQTICSGATTGIALSTTNGVGGATYTWTRVDAGVSGVLVGSGASINETLTATGSTGGTATYTITPAAGSCNGTPITVIVTVNPLPNVVAAPSSQTICSGTSSNIALSTNNGVAGATYSWTVVQSNVSGATSGFGTSINQILTATTSSAGTATYTITPSASGCNGTPIVVVVTVSPVPNVVALPASQTICSGATTGIALSTTNGVGGATYTWTRVDAGVSGVLVGSGASINETLTATGSTGGTATYTITPAAGSCNGTPITVIVTVNPLPNVVAAPSSQTICSGTSSNIALSTNNGVAGATYSWTVVQSNVSGATSGFGTSINQILTATTSSAGTATYTITPSASGCNGTPIVVVVTVSPVPNVVALPASQTICSGATTGIALSTTNGVGGATYTWTRVDAGVSGVLVGSGASINETLTATGSTGGTATYTITPAAGSCNGTPITVIVTVNPLPNVVAAPSSQTICSGTSSNIALSTSNGVAGATYSWTVVQINVSGASSGFGTSINQILTATTSSAGTATYTITPTASGCNGVPIVVVVTVSPSPQVSSTPLSIIRCSGGGAINFTPAFTVLGTTYTWTSSVSGPVSPASVTATGSSTIMDNPVNTGSVFGIVTYSFTPTAPGGCVGSVFNYLVTVNPQPVGANDTKVVCSNTPISYSLLLNVASLGNNVGSTFNWVAADNVNPLVTGESTTSQSGPSITDIIVNKTNIDQVVVYTVTPTSTNGCVGASFQITITVKPEPVGFSQASPDICSESIVAYDLQNNVNALGNALASNFTWTALAHPNVTGETTSLKSGSVIDDMLINITGVNQIVTYIVTPTSQAGGCLGNSFTILVTVNPKAIFTAGPDLAVCVDKNDIEIQGSVTFAPSTYSWSGGTGTFDNNTLEKPRYILSASDKAIVIPTVRVLTLTIAASGVCPAEVKTMNLTINPLPNTSFIGIPAPPDVPENGADLELNAFQTGGLFTIVPGSGLNATSIDPNTGFDRTFLTPADATLYDGTPVSVNTISYTYTDTNGCMNSTSQNLRVNPLTVVDFAVQNSTTDSDGDYRICADTGSILLIPLDGGNPGLAESFASLTPGLTLSTSGSQYFIPTNGLTSGVYTIQFTYTNVANVTSFRTRNVKVQASPVVSFTSTGTCIDSPTVFINTSSVNISNVNSPFAPTIGLVDWNFGDFSGASGAPAGTIPPGTNAGKTTGTYNNPSHTYGNASGYIVSLKITTTQGCSSTYTSPTTVIVGTIPVVDFDYFAICNNDSTRFKALITNLGSSTIAQYNWDFDDGDILSGLGSITPPANSGRTIGTYDQPVHKFITTGMYNPNLTVTTNLGCASLPKTRPVTIVPYVTVVATSGNPPEDFETSNGGWFIENLVDPDDNTFVSWKYGSPAGSEITVANSTGNNWWTGKNTNSYFSNEKSVVNSPCFDMDNIERPMIALDYFSDLESSLDGVVLQYSVDGGASWELVGPAITEPRDQGINWFNGQGIPSNPGNQILGQYGWTNKQVTWKNARFNLDKIPKAGAERKQVRFRLALGSNGTNDPTNIYDGFAFDNFFVGEKARQVLVEHFTTSTLNASLNADNYLNGLYQQQFIDRGYSDFDHIQYHVNFFGTDPLNKDNPTDPAARALYFGASQPPYTIMDGLLVPGKFTGVTNQINKVELDRRALVEPPFLLSLKDTTSSSTGTISVKMTIEATKDFTSPVIINVALVEKDIAGTMHVLRKNLFGSDGETINLTWVKGQKVIKLKFDVPIDVPISNPNGLLLIGYVQDKNTKEIYQSISIDAPVKNGSPIVGIEEEQPSLAVLNSIQLFPNPANQEFTFGLPADVHPSSQWRIIDQRGVTVLQGDFENAVHGLKQVAVSELSNGVYFVVMTGPNGVAVRKKLIVLNRN